MSIQTQTIAAFTTEISANKDLVELWWLYFSAFCNVRA